MEVSFSAAGGPVPVEIQSLLQEVRQSLQEVEAKVGTWRRRSSQTR